MLPVSDLTCSMALDLFFEAEKRIFEVHNFLHLSIPHGAQLSFGKRENYDPKSSISRSSIAFQVSSRSILVPLAFT